jgi:membrane-bound lytic murein transglycosylase MltF
MRRRILFSIPLLTGVDEIVMTGPASPPLKSFDDLPGKKIYVRKSSSYYESRLQLNARFKKSGRKPVKVVPVDEYLEDEDLLEMMNVGLIPMIVIDSHKAEFWTQVFPKLKMHADLILMSGFVMLKSSQPEESEGKRCSMSAISTNTISPTGSL